MRKQRGANYKNRDFEGVKRTFMNKTLKKQNFKVQKPF